MRRPLLIDKSFLINKTNLELGLYVGSGVDGEVFEIDKSDRVAKICIIQELSLDINMFYPKHIEPVLLSLIKNPINGFAQVYSCGCVGIFNIDNQKYVLYFYTMEKLEDISDDEKKVFHTILSHEDRGIVKNFSIEEVQEKLQGLSHGLDFDENKVIFFYDALKKSPIKHNDLHERNIMKDKMGNFKMVDFDRAQLHGE